MNRLILAAAAAIAVVLPAMLLQAQDPSQPEEAMPPMGPPKEMKDLSVLVGTWDVDMQWRNPPPDTAWIPSTAVTQYQYILDGSAMQLTFESQMMDMPMHGLGLQCFDRETGKWQMVWLDNLGARISYYEGECTKDKSVFTGDEIWQGLEYLNRITTQKRTETTFDWTMDMSTDGGQSWYTSGKATYTKRK